MNLKILGSGSSGNCYILDGEDSSLIIECGIAWSKIKLALDFNLNKVAGVLISHEHQDHCKAVKDVMAAGLNVFCSSGTGKSMGIDSHRLFTVKHGLKYPIGPFSVMPFNVKHDATEPFGFVINHRECGNVLFITDSYYVPFKFSNLNNILVEANYCSKIVQARLEANNIHGKVRDRVIESHMSINTCKDLLEANNLQAVNNIVLIHLSDGNSNAEDFKKQVYELTGKKVHIASRDMIIPFSKTPF